MNLPISLDLSDFRLQSSSLTLDHFYVITWNSKILLEKLLESLLELWNKFLYNKNRSTLLYKSFKSTGAPSIHIHPSRRKEEKERKKERELPKLSRLSDQRRSPVSTILTTSPRNRKKLRPPSGIPRRAPYPPPSLPFYHFEVSPTHARPLPPPLPSPLPIKNVSISETVARNHHTEKKGEGRIGGRDCVLSPVVERG